MQRGDLMIEMCKTELKRRLIRNKGWKEQARKACNKVGEEEKRKFELVRR